MKETYQERAERLYKLLDKYLDKRYLSTQNRVPPSEQGLLYLSVDASYQKQVVQFLRDFLACKVTVAKDQFGRHSGYLEVSLDTERLNTTGYFQAALALERMDMTES